MPLEESGETVNLRSEAHQRVSVTLESLLLGALCPPGHGRCLWTLSSRNLGSIACPLPTESSVHSCLEQDLVLIHRGACAGLSTAFIALSDLSSSLMVPQWCLKRILSHQALRLSM